MSDPTDDPVLLQDVLNAQGSPPPQQPDVLGMPFQRPAPPVMPAVPQIDPNKRRMQALVALAAGLAGGPNAVQGIGRGLEANWKSEDQAQLQHMALAQHQYARDLQQYTADTHAYEQEAGRRQQTLNQTVKAFQTQIAKGQIKTQDQYNQAKTGYVTALQSQGIRITPQQLEGWATFTPPSDADAIRKAIKAMQDANKDSGGVPAMLEAHPALTVSYQKADGTPGHMPMQRALLSGYGDLAGIGLDETTGAVIPMTPKDPNPSAARDRANTMARIKRGILTARGINDYNSLPQAQKDAIDAAADEQYKQEDKAAKIQYQVDLDQAKIAAGVMEPPGTGERPMQFFDESGKPLPPVLVNRRGGVTPMVGAPGSMQPPPGAAQQAQKEASKGEAQRTLDLLDKDIDAAAAKNLIGPTMGRLSALESQIGNPDPLISALATRMQLAKMQVDAGIGGMRAASSPMLLQRWDNLLSQKMTPANLHAVVQVMREMVGGAGATPSAADPLASFKAKLGLPK